MCPPLQGVLVGRAYVHGAARRSSADGPGQVAAYRFMAAWRFTENRLQPRPWPRASGMEEWGDDLDAKHEDSLGLLQIDVLPFAKRQNIKSSASRVPCAPWPSSRAWLRGQLLPRAGA